MSPFDSAIHMIGGASVPMPLMLLLLVAQLVTLVNSRPRDNAITH